QITQATAHDRGIKHARSFVQLADRLAKAALTDVMPADHERAKRIQVRTLKHRQRRGQGGGVSQPARQSAHPEGGGAAHAAKGADQPKSDSWLGHIELLLKKGDAM